MTKQQKKKMVVRKREEEEEPMRKLLKEKGEEKTQLRSVLVFREQVLLQEKQKPSLPKAA